MLRILGLPDALQDQAHLRLRVFLVARALEEASFAGMEVIPFLEGETAVWER